MHFDSHNQEQLINLIAEMESCGLKDFRKWVKGNVLFRCCSLSDLNNLVHFFREEDIPSKKALQRILFLVTLVTCCQNRP